MVFLFVRLIPVSPVLIRHLHLCFGSLLRTFMKCGSGQRERFVEFLH
jgi:hypothetical protein